MFVFIPTGEHYFIFPEGTPDNVIKQKLASKRKLMALVVGLMTAIIGLILWSLVGYAIKDMYQNVGQTLPFTIQISPIISILLGFFSYFSLRSILKSVPDFVTTKTNEGKLKVTMVRNNRESLLVMLVVLLSIGLIVYIHVQPIFALENSL